MTWFALALTVSLMGGLVVFVAGTVGVNRGRTSWTAVITTALLWVWAWWVLAMTFGTRSGGGSALNLKPLDVTNQSDVVDFALNVLMFLPAGVLLAVRGVRVWVVLLIAGGGSLAIEVMQFILKTGRTSDLNDLVANTVGCLIGFLLTSWTLRTIRRNSSSAQYEARP